MRGVTRGRSRRVGNMAQQDIPNIARKMRFCSADTVSQVAATSVVGTSRHFAPPQNLSVVDRLGRQTNNGQRTVFGPNG